MGKKRIPVDKKQFEALKNELERVSGIDLSSDNAYYDLCDYIKKQNDIKFPPSKYEDGSIVQQPETISVDTLRRYWGDKDADKQMTPDIRIGGHSAMNIYSLILALMRKKDLMERTILSFPHCVKMK